MPRSQTASKIEMKLTQCTTRHAQGEARFLCSCSFVNSAPLCLSAPRFREEEGLVVSSGFGLRPKHVCVSLLSRTRKTTWKLPATDAAFCCVL